MDAVKTNDLSASADRSSEEFVNCATHGAGIILSVAGTIFLFATMRAPSEAGRFISCLVYTASLISVYTMSTLSHVAFENRRRNFYRALDQGCIFLLIAGTCTPMAVFYLPPAVCLVLMCAMWSTALIGFFTKVFLAFQIYGVSVWMYVVLGWLPILATPWFVQAAPGRALTLALVGGLFYTSGTIFLVTDHRCRYFHMIWHVFVMIASTLHFLGILFYVAWAT